MPVKNLKNIWTKIGDFFIKQSPLPEASAEDVLLYLADLIVAKQGNRATQDEIKKIMGLTDLDQLEQNNVAEELCNRFEKILSQYYDIEKVREGVRQKFNLKSVKLPFANKFLSSSERDWLWMKDKASIIAEKLLATMSASELDKFIKSKTISTLLEGAVINKNGKLDFSFVENRLFRLPPPWLKLGINLLKQLVSDLEQLLGAEEKNNF